MYRRNALAYRQLSIDRARDGAIYHIQTLFIYLCIGLQVGYIQEINAQGLGYCVFGSKYIRNKSP